MAKVKAKPTLTLIEQYHTTWTPQQRENWLALGRWIANLKRGRVNHAASV